MGLFDSIFGKTEVQTSAPEVAPPTRSFSVPVTFETHPATISVGEEKTDFSGMPPEVFNSKLARLRAALPRATGPKHGEISSLINAMEAYRSRFING